MPWPRRVCGQGRQRLRIAIPGYAGAGRRFEDFLYVKASHGIGAAVVIGGRPYRGATGLAGEIGRQPYPGEIWLAWNLGWSGYERYGFSWAYVPRVKFDKARQVNTLAWGLPKRPAVAR